jgi:hypothetical protein
MLFICDTENCANEGREYVFEDETAFAECGACGFNIVGKPIKEEEVNG